MTPHRLQKELYVSLQPVLAAKENTLHVAILLKN
jgi:hypothetical protein